MRLASGLAVSCRNVGELVARDLALVGQISLFLFLGFQVLQSLRGRAGKIGGWDQTLSVCPVILLLPPHCTDTDRFWVGKQKWAGDVSRGQEQVFI